MHGHVNRTDAAPAPEGGAAPVVLVEVAGPTASERHALRVLQVATVLVVLAAITWKTYELDRFFIPKELTLHLAACITGVLLVRRIRETRFTWVDSLLIVHVLLGLVSSIFATNHWLALRGLAISASGLAVFWVARVLQNAGLRRPLLGAIALAVVLGCVTSLMQTYGVETDFFSINRAPGGTFGNRNFVAHMAAFGLPVLVLVAVTARHFFGWLAGTLGTMLVVGTLFLTRSRAAWLAAGAVMLVVAFALVASPALRRHGRTWRRLLGMALLGVAGILGAFLTPNTLDWRSDNPYLESMRDVANYEEGSGRGRLVQYRQSLEMMAANPVLGVGPGNWAVEYADYAAGNDPSMDRSASGMTSNPWPSSDWVAFFAERGAIAGLLLVLAVMGIAVRGLFQLFTAPEADHALRAAALLGTLLATSVAGLFDAVLLLALPTLLVWAAVGALYEPGAGRLGLPPRLRSAALAALAILAGVGALRSATQLTAMGIHTEMEGTAWLQRAAFIDPGNYRVRLQLGRGGGGLDRDDRCAHAHAAHALYPNAGEARRLSSGCD